jgi:hypothetical protein
MGTRNPYRALMISVPRTGNTPEQIARAIMPERPIGRVLETFGNRARLISVGQSLMFLEDNWYMVVVGDTVFYAFAPQAGVTQAISNEITAKAGMAATIIPWSDERAKIRALGRRVPAAFKNRFC